jgi:hypothetical protein
VGAIGQRVAGSSLPWASGRKRNSAVSVEEGYAASNIDIFRTEEVLGVLEIGAGEKAGERG